MSDEYYCHSCGNPTEPVPTDHGGPEEFWGAKVHRPCIVDVCGICGSEDIEPYAEAFEEDGQPDEAQEWHDFDPDC